MIRYTLMLYTLIAFSCVSQKPLKDFYLKRSLKQDGEQMQFTVLDEDKHGVFFHNKYKFYYWYKAQHVLSTQGGSAGILLHGSFESFYESKQLARQGSFSRGLKDGKWMYWRSDGTICRIEHWHRGVQKGEQLFFNEKGERSESIDMSRNSSVRTVEDSVIITTGDKERIRIYDDNEELIRDECKQKGVLHGKVIYYEDGKKVAVKKFDRGEEVVREEKERKNYLSKLFTNLKEKRAERPEREKEQKEKDDKKKDKK